MRDMSLMMSRLSDVWQQMVEWHSAMRWPMDAGPVTVLVLGFLLGMKHALDADHVVAVSTLVSRHRTIWRASLVGAFWGIGHTATIFLVGTAVILFKVRIPEWLAPSMEFAVGMVLVALGASGLRGYFVNRVHVHPHRHGDHVHAHFHSHAAGVAHEHEHVTPQHRRSLVVGMVHGLAGGGALILLVLATIRSSILALAYVMVFGVGSILGMVGVSTLLSLPFVLSGERLASMHWKVRIAAGTASVVYGLWIMASVGAWQMLLR